MSLSYVVDGETELDSALFNPWVDHMNGLQTGALPIALPGITGALGEYVGPWRGPHDCREWGIDADENDHASDFATMVSELAGEDNRAVQFVVGIINVGTTVPIAFNGFSAIGARGAGASVGGTQIDFSGSGELFEIGSDSGNPYDTNEYNGYEWTTIEGISLRTVGGATALANGTGNYKAGTYGIRDWRGGYLRLIDCELRGFEYGVWGIQSDINRLDTVRIAGNKVGMYLGPRSDQLTAQHLYTLNNDTAIWLDRAWGARITALQSVSDGSTETPAVRIGTNWSLGCNGIVFDSPWFEHVQGEVAEIDAFVEIGVGDSVASDNIVIRNPLVLTSSPAADYHVKHLVRIEAGDYLSIEDMSGVASALEGVVRITGSTSPRIRISGSAGTSQELAVVNESMGSPQVYRERWSDRLSWSHGASATSDDVTFLPSGSGVRVGIQNSAPTSTLHVQGSVAAQVSAVSADTLLTSGHHTVLVDASGAARTMTLQAASTMIGRIYTVKKTDSSGNGVVIDGNDSETIDGTATKTITSQYGFLTIQSDGSRWHVTAQGGTIT